jgi:hypothetical protein
MSMASARSKWMALAGAGVLAAIVVATLIPADMQIRTGLHWRTEHFLVYFLVTAIFCLAWPRPLVVGVVLVPVALLLETLQGLTPDRTPDLPTAFAAAAGVLAAAALAYLLTAAFRALKRRKAAQAASKSAPRPLARDGQI